VAENKSVTFFGAGTMDVNPPVGPVAFGDVPPDPAITGISPTTIADSDPLTLSVSGVGFTRRHIPTQVRIETSIDDAPVNVGFTDNLLTATFSTGLTPDGTYDVFVDFSDGTSLQSPVQLVVTP